MISKLRNKPKHFLKCCQILLLRSGDISLNPGPCLIQSINDKKCRPAKVGGYHSFHLNVNSLLSKFEKLRYIINSIRPAILGIAELILDSSVPNKEVNINGYSIIRNNRNRYGGGVACYIRNNLDFRHMIQYSYFL